MKYHLGTMIAGLFFMIMGSLFLLDELNVIDLQAKVIWPAMLIGLGAAVVAGSLPGRVRDERDPVDGDSAA